MFYSTVKPMHIPDGFLSVVVSLVLWIVSIALIAIALKKVKNELGEREVPLMGVLAAAIFAGQMLNFSVTGGTSGHLLGAAIATILLGPWAAVLVMTSVVSVQALLFQDGGILALGSNIFNMGIVGVFVSYVVFTLFKKLLISYSWVYSLQASLLPGHHIPGFIGLCAGIGNFWYISGEYSRTSHGRDPCTYWGARD
jgi:cobalt/nickel transport system permease protein